MPDRESPDDRRRSMWQRFFRSVQGKKAETAEDDENAASSAPREMRLRVAEFESARVSDVMVPRAEIASVEVTTNGRDLMQAFAAQGHSRLPVYRDTLDDPLGFIHIKDLLACFSPGGASIDDADLVRTLIRRALYVPASMRLADLLVKMQSTRIHIALVVDEYGGTDGLVTLEDLVEQIVGDIADEHDQDQAMIEACGRGVWEADARIAIADVEALIGVDMTLQDHDDDIDTLGGLIFALAGRIPERGEVITHPHGVDLEIMDADPRRLKRLRVRRRKSVSGKTGASDLSPLPGLSVSAR